MNLRFTTAPRRSACLALWLGALISVHASTPASRAEEAYQETGRHFKAEPGNLEAAWQFARACFDHAEFATNDTDRAAIANEGIAAAHQAVALDSKSVAAHYYLAMDLAELARTKLWGALSILREFEIEFIAAQTLNENFDFAGPDRNLGILYLEAPGWPISIGDHAQARQHLLRAVQLAPDYPENHLNLLDAYIKWKDREGIEREQKKYIELLPLARKQYSGEEWESSWTDWDKRWADIQVKLKERPDGESPHHKR